ncbi:hypothetical protein QTP70_026052 [Hemibagrus guttatus]|uniref:Inter-alpha-trypsin inhibitor heavy chain H3 n=1 Tax=Hemibagrus guttatus TaxID=175788 RepID=A0AAE0Q3B4_9TELE|nr:hypothetical protein QTP70_026052 [Hemibagrus guttatus]
MWVIPASLRCVRLAALRDRQAGRLASTATRVSCHATRQEPTYQRAHTWAQRALSTASRIAGSSNAKNSNTKKPNLQSHEIEMQKVKIDCIVTSRFAHTVMTSTALNKANVSQEVYFDVELPKTAFITNFSMEIDGKTYVGEVNEKEKAKKEYETAVSSGQSAGLVKASGRKMEKFSVSVNIAANSSVTFTFTYEELLQRRLGKYELMIRVKPKQLVQHFEIVATIYEPQGITHLDTNVTFITNDLLPLVKKEVTDKKAHVSFSPTLDQQRKCPDCDGTLIDGDFIITYDVNREQKLGDIQIMNGYFVHFFAPHISRQLPKNVVFVIDRSGSMSGTKMKQTREALSTILDDLYEDDHFGLVIFDDEIESWRPSLSKATNENIQEAKEYVKGVSARHMTDINRAVLQAVDMLSTAKRNNSLPDNSPSMIILLTDGEPTIGETNTSVIQHNVHNATGGDISIFCLGFGYDVYYGFLGAMAHQNDGVARRIYEDSDAALQLQGFYREVASPLLLEVKMSYPNSMNNSLTTNHFKQFFSGSEIVVAGRLNDLQQNTLDVEVSAQMLEKPFVVQGKASPGEWAVTLPEQEYIFGDFTERLWAYLTIQQLLNKQDTCIPKECENVTAEALDLSLKYNFVTPLTSMVVTKPETNDTSKDTLIADKLTEDERRDTAALDNEAVAVDGDPHFIIELPDQNDALCFNTDDKPGTIFNLVKDPVSGLVVNGKTIGDKKVEPGSKPHTYFGQFGIVHEKFKIRLMVTTQKIIVSEQGKQEHLRWSQTSHVKGINMDLEVSKDHSLTVTLKDTLKFIIILHKVWKMHPYHQDYLGFYNLDSHHLSQRVHGLLGQFFHGVTYEVSDVFQGKDPDKPDATMYVKGHSLTVTRGWQRDFRKDVKNGENVPCWFIHNNGAGLIDGVLRDYIVSGLFTTVSEGKGEKKEIDGKTYVGNVKEKEKAKKQYEAAVSSGQTAGLVKASGRKMEKFSVSVNIAANSSVTFTFTYEELLQRRFGKYELMIRVKPKQLVQHFEIVADVYEPQGIAFLNAHGTFITNELLPLVEKTVTDKRAHVSFSPTLDQQRKCPGCDGTLIDGDFFINYDVNRVQDLGDIQIVNGYFVHFFGPANLPKLPKNVVFVIDKSGSMSGTKMQQTREALRTIINDLHEEDHFGLVTFSRTNINDPLLLAVKMLKDARNNETVPENSASMIILLTDGNPNVGESNEEKIQENVQNAISGNMTLFCLGFGLDVHYGFLDVLAKQNNGLARRIYEGSDAVLQLQGFYDEIANVLLSDVNFRYPDNLVNSVTGSNFKQLFNGSEIVVAGRLNDLEMNDFPVEVYAQSLDEEFVLKGQATAQDWNTIFPDQEYIFGDFTERLWAYLTIQNLLDKIEKGSPEEKQNATAEALELSLKYNFVTTLTSMVVTKPETEEKPEDMLIADKLTEDQRRDVPQVSHSAYNQQIHTSSVLNWVDSDPHFIIEFADQNDALCFNINDKPGTIFKLIKDPLIGVTVNGQTIGDKKIDPENTMNTYFGSFGIVHAKFGIRLLVTTQYILVSEKGKQAKLFWSDNTSIKGPNMDLQVAKDHSLTVTLRNSVKFVIVLHKVWKKHPYHQDYLGFYTLDSHLFSHKVHGLLAMDRFLIRPERNPLYLNNGT